MSSLPKTLRFSQTSHSSFDDVNELREKYRQLEDQPAGRAFNALKDGCYYEAVDPETGKVHLSFGYIWEEFSKCKFYPLNIVPTKQMVCEFIEVCVDSCFAHLRKEIEDLCIGFLTLIGVLESCESDTLFVKVCNRAQNDTFNITRSAGFEETGVNCNQLRLYADPGVVLMSSTGTANWHNVFKFLQFLKKPVLGQGEDSVNLVFNYIPQIIDKGLVYKTIESDCPKELSRKAPKF